MTRWDAVVLAGGRASRLHGVDKPALRLGGRSLLDHALDAVAAAERVVVVGPQRTVTRPVSWTREEPVGSGPLAALGAGLSRLSTSEGLVAVLAADQPGVTAATVSRLRAALSEVDGADGALLVDAGRRQWLTGVWRIGALRAAMPEHLAGAALRALFGGLTVVEVPADVREGRDVDTPEDLAAWRAGYPDPGSSV
ncbi:molybdenum cofactor guanylyltransferase [Crossiella cryophila]|uniref:Molybdopterin-guanine dinucleotide biosynthesis protein A n=1 Tax=Crossiella cryophila TaxID=43355 RepID=A0A7W7CD23_9PSEU|nr:NTP transferase domain-containing protein [Crossiella cryophila]MBB4677643.1 molybdopterin-guanine dinucleotide biosynthesis protein A [Crossiella cryophila]